MNREFANEPAISVVRFLVYSHSSRMLLGTNGQDENTEVIDSRILQENGKSETRR